MWRKFASVGQWFFIGFCVFGFLLAIIANIFPKLQSKMQDLYERHTGIFCVFILLITVMSLIGITGLRYWH